MAVRAWSVLALVVGFCLSQAGAQKPEPPVKPAGYSTKPDGSVMVSPAQAKSEPANAALTFPLAMADAKAAIGKLRDYSCVMVQTYRVAGKMQPEMTAELRVRTSPVGIYWKATAPKEVTGAEVAYSANRYDGKVRFKPAGVDGVKYGFQSVAKDDAKLLAATHHAATDLGLAAAVAKVETLVATETKLNHPIQILSAEYTYAGRPCTRFDIFADRPHPHRVAYRCVLFVDKETRLPVRLEMYDQPKAGSNDGEPMEIVSFLGTKTNTGLGEAVFDR